MTKRHGIVGLIATLIAVMLAVPASAATTVRILVLGDSITSHCGDIPAAGYCGPLGALLDAAGVQYTFLNEAVGGTDCGYTATNINTFLAKDLPDPQPTDMVLLDCGTNNIPVTQASQDTMGAQWRTIVEAVHTTPAKLGISFIGYSNPLNNSGVGTGLPGVEGQANDVIYRWWQYEIGRGGTWTNGFAGLADFELMPGNLDYLDSGGIHPTALGYRAMAYLWYRSLMVTMGWPVVAAMCGMWGFRAPYSPPAFTQCTGTTP